MTEIDERIGKLEAELTQLRQQQRDEQEARKRSVEARWCFILAPSTERRRKLADPTCLWYHLVGTILNADEFHKVGAPVPHQGGMNYLFNRLSERFVMSSGGGTSYLRLTEDDAWGKQRPDLKAFQELEAFVVEHPEGGDVTEIVQRARALRGES